MYPNNNCNTCDDCPPICLTFKVGGERLQPFSCAIEQSGIYNDKPYYQLYETGCTVLTDLFVWWNIITNRWELTDAIGSGGVISFIMNPGLHPISNSGFNWIDNSSFYFIVSSLEGPCPGPLPLPDLSGLCGEEYPAACVIYTGEDIDCLGITSGMTFLEVLAIFNNILPGCDCCEKNPVDCVVGPWSDWGECKCYYEDELPVCGRQSRTRIVTTPPQDGGAACPPLIEYRPCTVSSVCFTFGSDICGTEPVGTQITVAPTGIHDDKPYYSFTICGEPQSVWWSIINNKWHVSPLVGVPDVPDFTLDNNDNYYPVSNTTTQLWNNPSDDTNYLDLIQSTLNTCPTYLVCFHLRLTIEGVVYNFFNSVAPLYTPFDTGDHPFYSYSVSDGTTSYTVIIVYSPSGGVWNARVDGVLIGTLPSSTFYPYGTWVVNPLNITSYVVSATLGGSCVQPPDVDCVLNCGPWSECIGGTRTRTCTVVTPPSGNGTPCPPLIQTEQCAVPNCFPPTAVVATNTGSGIVISFTAASGAASYQVSYSIDGGTPVLLSGVTSPITLPYLCDSVYTGTIVTQCSNGLTSSPVSWGPITTGACGYCPTEPPHPMIGGLSITSPGATIALDANGDTVNGGNLNFGATGYTIRDIVLIPAGYIYAGDISYVAGGSFSPIAGFFGAILIGCDFVAVPSFFGSGFTTATNGQGSVYNVVYDAATDRIYVGGVFAKYKGVNCTPNFVVLRGVDGNIDTTFATNSVGAVRTTGNPTVFTIAIQSDGRILVGGAFDSMYGNTVNCKFICRFLPTGIIDTSFTPGASVTNAVALLYVDKIKLDATDNIYIGGVFNAYQGATRLHLAKLFPSGLLNPTFIPGAIIFSVGSGCTIASVIDIEIQGSNILIGGAITNYGGTTVYGLVRISSTTGLIDPAFNIYTPGSGPIVCPVVHRIVVKNNRIHVGSTWRSYNISNKALYHVLDANGTPVFNTTVVITPAAIAGSAIKAILLLP